MTQPQAPRLFFAYAGRPTLRAEAIRNSIKACERRGLRAEGWETLPVAGSILIDVITERIDATDYTVAEISSANPNVLFEAGYALGKGRGLLLAIDESDEEAHKSWDGLALVDTIGRLNYGGNAERLASIVAETVSEGRPPLIETFLASALPKEANTVFAPGVPHKFEAASRLERLLERKTYLKLLVAQDELGLASLAYYCQELYRSSAAVLHFMKPSRVRAPEYNSRLSLLAGVAHGLEIPLLMVAEEEYRSPLDYKDLLYRYSSIAGLTQKVENWLDTLPTPRGSNKRLGRLKLDIELPVRSFGQFVAEYEADDLTDYFVHTNEFEAVLNGRATLFTGRKGTGKTACMAQATEELRKDRRVLVAPIKPSSYDLAALTGVLDRIPDHAKRDYFLINLWSYLLVTEIAARALSHAESLPAGLGGDASLQALQDVLTSSGIDRAADLGVRLDEAIERAGSNMNSASEGLRSVWLQRIMPALRPVLHEYDRVAVLIDNLDKTWERGVDFEGMSHFLLQLLVSAGRLSSELEKTRGAQPSVKLTITTFLRTDIFDVIRTYAREPDKISPQAIQWDDEELLARVLTERYAAKRTSSLGDEDALWTEVFTPEVHGMATRDYLLWRALPRPRDLIYLGNAALTTAINRSHSAVQPHDFIHAEKTYSRFAVEALLVESEAQGFDLEPILFEFAGLDAIIDQDDLDAVLGDAEDAGNARDWLIQTSFLGVEARDGHFVHVEGESEARKKERVAARIAAKRGSGMRYRIHPAFRPYLDVRDSDVYD